MFAKRIERLSSSLVREILEIAQNPEIISFAGGLPAKEAMPEFDLRDIPEQLRQYGVSEGEEFLRVEIAEYVTRQGRPCSADQILITSGSQQAIDLVSKLFLDEGSKVLLESPTYLAAIQSFRLFGAEFQDLTLSPTGIDPEQLRQCLLRDQYSFAYLIPSFQNPAGTCYSSECRQEVAALLEEFKVPLIEDDPYRELVYEKVDRKPIVSELQNNEWVYMGSFSKTGIPGFRIGYLVASPQLYTPLFRLKQATDLHSNRIGQYWAANFLSGEGFEKHLEKLRQYYKVKRDVMHDSLNRHFRGIAAWDLPLGGLFFWVRLKADIDTMPLLQQALERKVAFMPGTPFFANPMKRCNMMRLNFSHATTEQIEQGISILAEVVKAGMD
ncbi:MAG: GntR family transcriptional regulator [SAR324 cluster bacterium]|uniref:GntR family transcriptional regulator n=1 Tax=SAR324 cluster bacterium TaxID=2024889 RepID=A0A2A4T7Z2_9DELT|nr:MAG: GntR family transcriptional regulator [SAR324 cluster bacterium]